MTAEERAYDLCNRIEFPGWGDDVTAAIADVIRAAVAEEREACARIADNNDLWAWQVAGLIRARSNP